MFSAWLVSNARCLPLLATCGVELWPMPLLYQVGYRMVALPRQPPVRCLELLYLSQSWGVWELGVWGLGVWELGVWELGVLGLGVLELGVWELGD